MKRGQISIEYLVIVGFVVFLVITIIGIGYFYAAGTKDSIKFHQLESFADTIVSTSESVYYAGEPSQRTITAYLPPAIQAIQITPSEIIFNVSTSSGLTRIGFTSTVPINGTISPSEGVKRLVILARNNDVLIEEE